MTDLKLTEEQKNEIIIFMADDIMKNLNLNGIIEATKAFALENASRQYEELTDEQLKKVMGFIAEQKAQANAQSPVEATETPA
tara:strand:+ start:424 stop:672 length:249 start_codon:yes stop_codon:yes gene_type:complete